jgi:hypothetical protein
MTKSMDPSTPDRSRSWGALAGIVLGMSSVAHETST